jgi:chemotaxis protein MotB
MSTINHAAPKCPPCPTGSPMWMTTFADMATLLMAFFVLLVAFANMDPAGSSIQVDSQERGPGIQNEIVRMESLDSNASNRVKVSPVLAANFDQDVLPDGTKDYAANDDLEILETALASEIAAGKVQLIVKPEQVVVQIVTYDTQGVDRSGSQQNMRSDIPDADILVYSKVAQAQLKTSIDIVVDHLPAGQKAMIEKDAIFESQYQRIFSKLSASISEGTVFVVREGDKVIIRLSGSASFASGQATLRPKMIPLIGKVVDSLVGLKGSIIVEGHTDNMPVAFNEIYRSNWDLSSARAAAVAQYFVTNPQLSGLSFMVSGLADIYPIANNTRISGRAMNRRIEIILDTS